MLAYIKSHRWILMAVLVHPSLLSAYGNDSPVYAFDRKTSCEFTVSDPLATPLIQAFEASTGQQKDSMAPRLTGLVRACGNWAALTGEVSVNAGEETNSVPLAVLFLKSRHGWLVVDFAGAQELDQTQHWPATYDMPVGLIKKPTATLAATKPQVNSSEPTTNSDTIATPTPKPKPEVSPPSPHDDDNDALATLNEESQLLQQEIITLQNQLKDLPDLRDAISDKEFARNVKKFDAMGKKFSSLKDAYIESAERAKEKHILANELRKSLDTAKLRLDEITRQLHVAKFE